MTIFLLIRHATNDAVGKSLAGWTPGVHLNEEGKAQAEQLVGHLAQVALTAIYSSPLERAIETAQPVAASKGLEITIDQGLGEIDFGEWTGKTIKELAETPTWGHIQRFPSGTRIPGGETLREMQYRVVTRLEALRHEHPKGIIAVFAHADVIKAMMAHYLGVHLDLFQRIVISPASVSVVSVSEAGPHVLRMNDTGAAPVIAPPSEAPTEPAITPETERPVG